MEPHWCGQGGFCSWPNARKLVKNASFLQHWMMTSRSCPTHVRSLHHSTVKGFMAEAGKRGNCIPLEYTKHKPLDGPHMFIPWLHLLVFKVWWEQCCHDDTLSLPCSTNMCYGGNEHVSMVTTGLPCSLNIPKVSIWPICKSNRCCMKS